MTDFELKDARPRMIPHLHGARSKVRAFLDLVGSRYAPEDVSKSDDLMLDEIEDGLKSLIDGSARRRILASTHPLLERVAELHMGAPIARMIAGLGVDPVGLAALDALDLPVVTIRGGVNDGVVLECEGERRQEGDGAGRREALMAIIGAEVIIDTRDNEIVCMDRAVPEAVAAALVGRRVSEVVTSPLLGGEDPIIEDAEVDGIGLSLTLVEPEWVPIGRAPMPSAVRN